MYESLHDIWVLIELGKYPEAISRIETELKENPESSELFHARAYISWLNDELESGLALVEQGLAISPKHHGLRHIYFKILAESNLEAEAEGVIIELLSETPADEDYLCDYSRLMLRAFQIPKARKLCDEALRIAPDSDNALTLDYLINVCEGKVDHADKNLEQLVKNSPENEHTLSLIVSNLLNKNRFREAEPVVQELIRISPHEQGYIETAVDIRTVTHWSSRPLWIFNRFGWSGSIGLWIAVLVLVRVLDSDNSNSTLVTYLIFGYLGLVIYSWVQPPLLKRWLTYRGI